MEKTKISLNVPNDVHERIVKLADLADMSCKKVGILQFTILMRDLGEKMKEWAENVKKKKIEPL